MINRSAVLGAALGVVALVLGHILLGGSLFQLLNLGVLSVFLALLFGALLLSHGGDSLKQALRLVKALYVGPSSPQLGMPLSQEGLAALAAEIVEAATRVRKQGLVAADTGSEVIHHPLLKRSLKYLTDGFEPATIQEILDSERDTIRRDFEQGVAVLESALAWAPPIGVIASLLGLIQVMSRLSDPLAVGSGMGVALLAMLYGLATTQIFFAPWSRKLQESAQGLGREVDLVKLAVSAIQQGLPPSFLQEKLSALIGQKR